MPAVPGFAGDIQAITFLTRLEASMKTGDETSGTKFTLYSTISDHSGLLWSTNTCPFAEVELLSLRNFEVTVSRTPSYTVGLHAAHY